MVKISSIFVAFLENMNFKRKINLYFFEKNSLAQIFLSSIQNRIATEIA